MVSPTVQIAPPHDRFNGVTNQQDNIPDDTRIKGLEESTFDNTKEFAKIEEQLGKVVDAVLNDTLEKEVIGSRQADCNTVENYALKKGKPWLIKGTI